MSEWFSHHTFGFENLYHKLWITQYQGEMFERKLP
jgi:hypothetical protein